QYLSDAYLQGYSEVRIVHGKGSGVLRKGLHEYFAKNKNIKSFRIGQYGEGDSGVTIVTLK
ncbi:MAG: Smr/MutS family protein, partial [Clostridia bacterium]